MPDVPAFQIVLGIVGHEGIESEELEAAAEAVLEGVEREAAFIALGPVVSVDFGRPGRSRSSATSLPRPPRQSHAKMVRITEVMLKTAIPSSTTAQPQGSSPCPPKRGRSTSPRPQLRTTGRRPGRMITRLVAAPDEPDQPP